MTKEIKTEASIEAVPTIAVADSVVAEVAPKIVEVGNVAVAQDRFSDNRGPRGGRTGGKPGQKGGRTGGRPRTPREKPEFDSKTISIRRVTRVVSGGRRFALSVAIVAGDHNGRIGLGTGKAADTQVAIEKALKAAKRNMVTLKLSKQKSLTHDVSAKFNSSEVMIMPNKGRGLIAGSSARAILALAGLTNVTAKFHSGTKNKLNNARATMKALAQVAYAYDEAPVQATKVGATPVVVAETN
jgi:small subunit ribosomal protein S5